MFFKKGNDYIYLVTKMVITPENEKEEITLHKSKDIVITGLKNDDPKTKAYHYFRITILNNKANVQMYPKTLVAIIKNKKLKNKMVLNLISQNIAYHEYTFENSGYLIFGKMCEEENI